MLAKVLFRCSAQAAIRSALAPALILLIIGSVILGGFGVPVPMLGKWLFSSPTYRLVLFAGWALLFLPAARAALSAKGARALLHFPRARILRNILSVMVLAILAIPLALLLFVGGGMGASVMALLSVVAFQIVVASACYPLAQRLLQLSTALLLSWILLCGEIWWMAILSVLVIALGTGSAIRRCDEGSKRIVARALFGNAFVAILLTHALRIWRVERTLVLRMGLATSVGILLMRSGWASDVGEDTAESLRIALAMQTPMLAAISIMLALAGRESLRELHWLLFSHHLSREFAMATLWVSSFVIGGAIAVAIAQTSLVSTVSLTMIWLAGALVIHSFVLSGWAHWLCFGPLSGTGQDPSRPAVYMFVLSIVLCIALSIAGHWVLLLEVVSVPAAWVFGQRRRNALA